MGPLISRLAAGVLIGSIICTTLGAEGAPVFSAKERDYLDQLYRATFDGLAYFVHPRTGLPYDVSDRRRESSISNIGLYLASVAVASRTGLLSDDEARSRIDRGLSSLEQVERWRGFPVTWIDVETLRPAYGPRFSYADHVGNLVCGLLVCAGVFPETFGERVETLIAGMEFNATYDEKTGWLKGGYDSARKDFTVDQPWGSWYYNLFASDTRPFSLIGIALGQIPRTHWKRLTRERTPAGSLDWEIALAAFPQQVNDMPYYAPGMEGGGLFMQYLPGIFLDERDLAAGRSARQLAKAEIDFARIEKRYPFWPVSASESPDGTRYLGWASLQKTVVTAHAAALAIEDWPQEALAALRAIEQAGGRPGYADGEGTVRDLGFTDSYDSVTGRASAHYLSLDQGMLFLSLANVLHGGVVRAVFGASALGARVIACERELEKE